METYLVTGGAGFIGSNIVEELLRQNKNVKVLDNFSTGKKENLITFKQDIEIIEGDITNFEVVKKSIKNVDYVFHLAAMPSVQLSIEKPERCNKINVEGTLNILIASRDANVKRVVFSSSSAIYGDSCEIPKTENMIPSPVSPYGLSKLFGEYYCKIFYKIYQLETISLRYFNVFGKRQDPNSHYAAVIPKFIEVFKKNNFPTIFGDGTQSRDFVHIENVVEANILASQIKKTNGEILNIGCGISYTLLELVDYLKNIFGKDISPIFLDERIGDIKHSVASILNAEKFLNYKVKVGFQEGLKNTVDWYLNQKT